MPPKKVQKSYHLMRRFDVTISMVVIASDFDSAVATAKAMTLTDFVSLHGSHLDNAEPLHGMAVSEID